MCLSVTRSQTFTFRVFFLDVGTGVTTNCLHPGVVNTDIFNPMISHVWYGIFIRLYVWAYAKVSG